MERKNKMLRLRKHVTFKELYYEDIENLSKLITCYIPQQEENAERWNHPLWKYILMELNLNDLKIKEVIWNYEPSVYWLSHLKTTLAQLKDIATKVEREDTKVIIEEWLFKKIYTLETNLNDISKVHFTQLAENLRIRSSGWADWRMFADTYGYNCDNINRIHSLARDEMKTMWYILEHYGDRKIKIIKDIGEKYNIQKHSLIKIEKLIRKM